MKMFKNYRESQPLSRAVGRKTDRDRPHASEGFTWSFKLKFAGPSGATQVARRRLESTKFN